VNNTIHPVPLKMTGGQIIIALAVSVMAILWFIVSHI